MSLTLAYSIARGALTTGGAAASIVSRNVANADNPNSSRKSAVIGADATGSTYLIGISGVVSNAVLEQVMESGAARSRQEVVSGYLEKLQSVVGDPESEGSAAAGIGALRVALQTATGAPHDPSVLQAVVTAATGLASTLNEAAEMVARVRTDANDELQQGISQLKVLLDEFAGVNREVMTGTARSSDVTDANDRRNGLMRQISDLIEVRATLREQNDLVLHLASGVTLFETTAREVAFDTVAPLVPGQSGALPRIDGVEIPSDGSISGRLSGLLQVRDEIALKAGRQLDEIARGLIVATAESDQSAVPTGPDQAGLFTYSGGPALPASGFVLDGLAGMIRVNASVDPQQGGNVDLVRDGGISDPGDPRYDCNPSNAAGFGDRLRRLISNLSVEQAFDSAAGIAQPSGGVLGFATDSAGWVEAARSASQNALDIESVRAQTTLGAWQSSVGVSLDDELAKLIALERSYQASSRLLTSVTGMFDALLTATR